MKLRGIRLTLTDIGSEKLVASRNINQSSPKRFYVYGHYDQNDIPFYIGKGKGSRAWSRSRHPYWQRYVDNHLDGNYKVKILADDLNDNEAGNLEGRWIIQEQNTLVNWVNPGREINLEASSRFHRLQKANRNRIAETRLIEKTDPKRAIEIYYEIISDIAKYATIRFEEDGLIGMLRTEELAEIGFKGELQALDRLTICLCRAFRKDEALRATENYFKDYRADLRLKAAIRILKRVNLVYCLLFIYFIDSICLV